MENNGKAKVFNLIILDKSGSMNVIRDAAIDGFNQTLETIRLTQAEFKETQEHYVSLLTFDSFLSDYTYDRMAIDRVEKMTYVDYYPEGGTALYDAIGKGITDLRQHTNQLEGVGVAVTIITDGMENSSTKYSGGAVRRLIEEMRSKYGWNFTYIGANQDVEAEATKLSISNHMEFSYDDAGMRQAWERERKSKRIMYSMMDEAYACAAPGESFEAREARMHERMDKHQNYREMSEFKHRVTPFKITELKPGQVFVFGSNGMGAHYGGAAMQAVEHFGAIIGQAEGLQGNSYAINSMDGLTEFREQVYRFIVFAKEHPELTFLVTRIGCGIAGYSVADVAPLFARAVDVENIYLPKDFWKELI